MFSTRHPERLRDTVGKLGPRALVGTSAEAARYGDVLLVAVPLPGASWDRTRAQNSEHVKPLPRCAGRQTRLHVIFVR
jgi:predicted dinucleotide-binding enzyme